MRALILIAGTLVLATPLGACKNNDQADNTTNIDENLTAENIVSNDVTAIDAVTGDAANMAAESSINDIGADNALNTGNMGSPTKPEAKKPAAKAPITKAPAAKAPASSTPSTTPVSNAASNAAE